MTKKRLTAMRADGAEVLKRIAVTLNTTDIQYFAAFGTLLGLIRDAEIIPYDPDIDLGVIKTDDFTWEKLLGVLEEGGFSLKHHYEIQGSVKEICVAYEKNPLVTADFFLFEREGDQYFLHAFHHKEGYRYESRDQMHVKRAAFPYFSELGQIEYHGIPLCIPSAYEQFLETAYTKNWRTPDPNWNSLDDSPNNWYMEGTMGRCVERGEDHGA